MVGNYKRRVTDIQRPIIALQYYITIKNESRKAKCLSGFIVICPYVCERQRIWFCANSPALKRCTDIN